MKALQLTAPSELSFVDLPTPKPGPGEVRVKVAACGICGSDIHGMDGSSGRRIPPVVMGHEASGVIDALGPGSEGWKIGDRVTFDSTVWCGECPNCLRGQVNLCDHRQVVGVSCKEFHRDGAFAEFLTLPTRILHSIPDSLSFAEAAFAEPVGVALHAVRRAGDVSGKSTLVVGSGLIGLLVIQALKRAGASKITAVDLDQSRLELARQLGADASCLPDQKLPEHDLAFEVVGAAPTLDLAIRSLRKGGCLVLVGNLSPSVPFPLQLAVTRELDVLGSCAIAGEYPDAIAAITSGEIKVAPLITETLQLSMGAEAFSAAQQPGALKVIVTP